MGIGLGLEIDQTACCYSHNSLCSWQLPWLLLTQAPWHQKVSVAAGRSWRVSSVTWVACRCRGSEAS